MPRSGFKTDVGRLSKLLQGLEKVPKQLGTLVASEISNDLAETYDSGANPYGTPWKLRKVDRPWPILNRTGTMRASRRVTVRNDGEVDVEYTDKKSSYHQNGTSSLPQRLLVPTTARGIPQRWRDALKLAFKKSLKELWP